MYRFVVDLLRPFPLLLLIALAAVAILWRRRVESRRRLGVLTAALVGLLVFCLPITSYLALGSLEWQYPPLKARPADTRAIVVLAGGAQRPDDPALKARLYPDSLYRCFAAADLYHEGPPCLVFASGGKVQASDRGPALAELMREFLTQLDVAPSDLRVEDRSRDTHENAKFTAELLKREGIERIVLVTDATHLPRAVGCFEREGIEVTAAGCSYKAANFPASPDQWIPSPGASEGVRGAVHEWLGLLYYWLRGWL